MKTQNPIQSNYQERMFTRIHLRFQLTELKLAMLTREITPAEYREKIDAVIAEINALPEPSGND
jgi:hypothetical protein